jgi:subtilisin family serine protease
MTRAGATLVLTVLAALCGCAGRPLVFNSATRIPAVATQDAARQLVVTIRDGVPSLEASPGGTPKSYGSSPQYRPSAYARRISDEIAREYGLTWVAEWRIDVLDVHCVVFRAKDADEQRKVLQRLTADQRIESVQPMNEFGTTTGGAQYNDPYFPLQSHVEAMRVPEAHRWARGRGVKVAVIDTGVDLDHPDLIGRIRLARNFVDDDETKFSADPHGTAVTGVIAAAVNNGRGIVGVAPEVQILALKACWHSEKRGSASCNTLTLAEAIAFALEARAAVINLSLTGPSDPLLTRLVEVAIGRGTVVVAAKPASAAGGGAFPVDIPGVLGVADADVSVAGEAGADIRAPGREILTLVPRGGYDYLSGVSLSSAMVSGVVALLLERNRALTPTAIESLLERTASRRQRPGAGAYVLVNACDAVASVAQAARCQEGGEARAGQEAVSEAREGRLR